jgi:hypothetical protein
VNEYPEADAPGRKNMNFLAASFAKLTIKPADQRRLF